MRKTWWRVPAYCIAAFVLGSQLVMFLESLGWPMELRPVGMLLLFLGWLLVGGWVFFRHMTQKEILLSATIAAVFQVLLAVALYIYTFLQVKEKLMTDYQNSVDVMESILDMEVVRTEPYQVSLWQIFRYADPRMLFRQIKMGMYPYLFVCFGKKEEAKPPEDGRRDSGDDGAETL